MQTDRLVVVSREMVCGFPGEETTSNKIISEIEVMGLTQRAPYLINRSVNCTV